MSAGDRNPISADLQGPAPKLQRLVGALTAIKCQIMPDSTTGRGTKKNFRMTVETTVIWSRAILSADIYLRVNHTIPQYYLILSHPNRCPRLETGNGCHIEPLTIWRISRWDSSCFLLMIFSPDQRMNVHPAKWLNHQQLRVWVTLRSCIAPIVGLKCVLATITLFMA